LRQTLTSLLAGETLAHAAGTLPGAVVQAWGETKASVKAKAKEPKQPGGKFANSLKLLSCEAIPFS